MVSSLGEEIIVKAPNPKKSDKAGETTQPEELTLAKGLGISSSAGLLYYQWTRS